MGISTKTVEGHVARLRNKFAANSKNELIDKVIGTVNQGVILKSEVDTIVDRVKKQAEEQNQQLPKDETLRVQAIERLVNQTLMMQMAERMGLEISDSQLDQFAVFCAIGYLLISMFSI